MIALQEIGSKKTVYINPIHVAAVEQISESGTSWVNVELMNGSTYSVTASIDAVVNSIKGYITDDE